MPNHLDGHFVVKLYDAEKQRLCFFTDFIRTKTNYMTLTDDYLMITPLLLLAAVVRTPTLDLHAFNEYLWRYYILSDRTMLRDVSRLQPAALYTLHADGKLSHQRYWRWPEQYRPSSFKQTAEELVQTMKDSALLTQQLSANPLIEFTMGQDSRQVLAAFTHQKIPFTTAIFGKTDYMEVPNVRTMCERHGFEHHHILLNRDYTDDPWTFFKRGIILGNAEEPGYLIGRILYMRQQYLQWTNLAINGVHGRYYKDGLWNEMYVFNLFRELKQFNVDVFLKYRALNKDYRDDIFASELIDIKSGAMDYFRQMVYQSIQGLEDSPVALQVDKFDADHYANFGTVANNTSNMMIDLLSPLLFRRNMIIGVASPPQWRFQLSALQRAVVYQLDAALAREKTDFGGLTMQPKNFLTKGPFLMRYGFSQSKKLRDKLKNKMGFKVKTQLQKAWDYLPIYQQMFHQPEVRKRLQYDRLAMQDIIEKEPWNRMLAEYDKPENQTIDSMEYLYKLLTVEYFLKQAKEIHQKGSR
ncbi:MAG: hypothetical protein GF313_06555 [Caldithrix sp.]|nr:hypothetical protein [Caldithrix sp.]